MGFKKEHQKIYDDDQVNRWYLNLRARSPISADIRRRNLALYCDSNNVSPEDILQQARENKLKNAFQDFANKLIERGLKGAYIAKFKHVLRSWLLFNDVDYKIRINIPNENVNETTEDERVPTSDEVARILRKATSRGRVSISLMAFSGLRPEVLGSYEGNDGLTLSDIEELDVDSLTFDVMPTRINVRSNLSKARFKYFTFLGEEGCRYLLDYLQERRSAGEILTPESSLLIPNPTNHSTKWKNLRTMLVTREIREAIKSSDLTMRPYILRAYFATALDIAESKGLISHPWRQFMMGHKGDMEAVYSTNKRPLPEKVDEMRAAYLRASQFFETIPKTRDDARKELKEGFIESVLMTLNQLGRNIEIEGDERERLLELDFETLKDEMKKILGQNQIKEDSMILAQRDKEEIKNSTSGTRQKVIHIAAIEAYVQEGFDFVTALPGDKAIVKLP